MGNSHPSLGYLASKPLLLSSPPDTDRLYVRLEQCQLFRAMAMLDFSPLVVLKCVFPLLIHLYRVVFLITPPPLKSSKKKYKKVNLQVRLGVSRTIYVNVDTPNLGFTYFNFFLLLLLLLFLGEAQCKKTPCTFQKRI